MNSALAVRQQTDQISEAMNDRQDQLAAFLPTTRHIERFKRVVIQSLAKNPDLLQASKGSIIAAAFEAARLGLEPSGAIGGAHIVRYGQTAQLIVDYRGLVELARRSDEILSIAARVVHEGESFKVHYGSQAGIEHEWDIEASPNPITAVYAIAKLRGGGEQFDVMTTAEVEAIRAKSRAANGPWRTDWAEMAKKTVLRRLCKLLPLTVEAREALDREDEAERTAPAPERPASSLAEAIAQRTEQIAGAVPDYVETPTYEGAELEPDDLGAFDSEDGLPDIPEPAAGEQDGTEASALPAMTPPAGPTLDDILQATGGTVDDTAVGAPAVGGGAVVPPPGGRTANASEAARKAQARADRMARDR
jgi:recombination protein RecT